MIVKMFLRAVGWRVRLGFARLGGLAFTLSLAKREMLVGEEVCCQGR